MRIASRAARMPRRVPVYSKAQRAHATHSPSHGLHGPAVDWDARGCHGRSSARPCRSWEELAGTCRAGGGLLWHCHAEAEPCRQGVQAGGPAAGRAAVRPGSTHSEIQNLTGVFGFFSYENIVYRHKAKSPVKF